MVAARRASAAALCALALAGCGNAIESVTLGPWEAAGQARAPVDTSTFARYAVTDVRPGDGREVTPGDLVRVRVTRAGVEPNGAPRDLPVVTGWLWTGDEGRYEDYPEYFGNAGSRALRAMLVGRRVGGAFDIGLDSLHPERGLLVMPRHGLIQPLSVWRGAQYESEDVAGMTQGRVRITARVEIEEACPGGLYRRTAHLTQWGWALAPGSGRDYPMSRAGELHWGAVYGDCPAPTGPVWMPHGPNRPAGMEGGNLYSPLATMQAKHPPAQHPGDWWEPGTRMPAPPRDLPPWPPRDAAAPAAATTPAGDRTAGAAFAADEGITRPEDCPARSPDFTAGCRAQVARQGGATPPP